MHAKFHAHMYKSPRKYVSDGKFTPEGTVQFLHQISVEGDAAKFYCDTDLTASLNGSRGKLDQGLPVEVVATVDLAVRQGKLVSYDLVALEEPAPATKG
jgi:hypothetical protein